MEFQLGHNLVSSYKRLSYKAWYALAEFVDNSTQAYFNNKAAMDKQLKKDNESLYVKINYSSSLDKLTIVDNSIGMNYDELVKALTLGFPPDDPTGRSRYGLGMKTAACWFGDYWEIKSKKLNHPKAYKISVDVDKIIKGEVDLPEEEFEEDLSKHYTEITITDLNRKLQTTTLSKIRDYLQSIYRIDFDLYGLQLYWQNNLLSWEDLTKGLYVTEDGQKSKTEFKFEVDGKTVKGWVGVLGKGSASRKNAGFSIIQANRVIEGWPKGYKPSTIFGDQEDGRNDLINQRVTGELVLEGFAVSHTKDSILWQGNQQEELEELLAEYCDDAMYLAKNLRFNSPTEIIEDKQSLYKHDALESLSFELESNQVNDYLESVLPPPEKVIEKSYKQIEETTLTDDKDYMSVTIGNEPNQITVNVFFNNNSEFDPYAIIELNPQADVLNVIVNGIHPYFSEFDNHNEILNFIRQCVYDGVSEWKAIKLIGEIKPNTVKFIKDGLLRLPYAIKNAI